MQFFQVVDLGFNAADALLLLVEQASSARTAGIMFDSCVLVEYCLRTKQQVPVGRLAEEEIDQHLVIKGLECWFMHYFWNSFVTDGMTLRFTKHRSGYDSADHIMIRYCAPLCQDFMIRFEFELSLNFFVRFELHLALLRCLELLGCNFTLTLLVLRRWFGFVPMYDNLTCNATEVVDWSKVCERWGGL